MASMNIYPLGAPVNLTVTFTLPNGNVYDPAGTITIQWEIEEVAQAPLTPTKISTGVYTFGPIDSTGKGGIWTYWGVAGAGIGQTASDSKQLRVKPQS